MKYKVLIPAAGLGTRVGSYSENINKALITIGLKPAISHIIDKFPDDIEFVICIGYKGDLLKDFLDIAYPNKKIQIVKVDKYEGIGSGLGYTILQAKEYLQCPFIFCANDTIVLDDIPEPNYNWIGYSLVDEPEHYRTIEINGNNEIASIKGKGNIDNNKAYIGLSGINDYQIFWKLMEDNKNNGVIEIGESFALNYMLKSTKIKAKEFKWFDVGNIKQLLLTKEYFEKDKKDINILEKPDEAIWFINDNVIKFNLDKEFIKNRIERTHYLYGFNPDIKDVKDNFYSYELIKGKTFTYNLRLDLFKKFLNDLKKNLWKNFLITGMEHVTFKDKCYNFYNMKTKKRILSFFKNFETYDCSVINGTLVGDIDEILSHVDWNNLKDGFPSSFHGDLHFENVIVTENEEFKLLDWRQDFQGILEYGDRYYDFAKIKHGLIISHEMVHKNLFEVKLSKDTVSYDFYRKQILVDFEKYFDKWLLGNGYDLNKVNTLTALIFLNIAALHHYPYCLLLYYLGKYLLWKNVFNKEI